MWTLHKAGLAVREPAARELLGCAMKLKNKSRSYDYIYICIYIYVYMYVRVHLRIYVYTCICVNAYMNISLSATCKNMAHLSSMTTLVLRAVEFRSNTHTDTKNK